MVLVNPRDDDTKTRILVNPRDDDTITRNPRDDDTITRNPRDGDTITRNPRDDDTITRILIGTRTVENTHEIQSKTFRANLNQSLSFHLKERSILRIYL